MPDSDILLCIRIHVDWSSIETTPPSPDTLDLMEPYIPALEQICSHHPTVMSCINEAASYSLKPIDLFLQGLIIPQNMDNIMNYACSKLNVIETYFMCGFMMAAVHAQDPTSCVNELGPQIQSIVDYINSTHPTQGGFDVPYFCSTVQCGEPMEMVHYRFRHLYPLPGCITSVMSSCNEELIDFVRTLTSMTVKSCGNIDGVIAASPELTSQMTSVLFKVLVLFMAFIL